MVWRCPATAANASQREIRRCQRVHADDADHDIGDTIAIDVAEYPRFAADYFIAQLPGDIAERSGADEAEGIIATACDGIDSLERDEIALRAAVVADDVGSRDSRAAVAIGEGEDIAILIKDNVMYVLNYDTNHEKLGQVCFVYKPMLNGLKADGSSLALADYPRVAELLDAIPAGSVVSEVTWQTQFVFPDGQSIYINKGKWMSDGTNFRPPDLRSKFLKAMATVVDGTTSGSYEHDAIKEHDHEMRGGFGFGQYDGGGNTFWRIRNTTDPFVADDIMAETGEVNNLVKNNQLYPIICI